eukprot:6046418-Karenia_brevis.AAC.1
MVAAAINSILVMVNSASMPVVDVSRSCSNGQPAAQQECGIPSASTPGSAALDQEVKPFFPAFPP